MKHLILDIEISLALDIAADLTREAATTNRKDFAHYVQSYLENATDSDYYYGRCDTLGIMDHDRLEDLFADELGHDVANALDIAADQLRKAQERQQRLEEALKDALSRLEEWTGTDCECDSTHEQNRVQCCLCEYRELLTTRVVTKPSSCLLAADTHSVANHCL